jgi:hypothetical protein
MSVAMYLGNKNALTIPNAKSTSKDIAWNDPLVQAILSDETEQILLERNPEPMADAFLPAEIMKFLIDNHPVTAVEPLLTVSMSIRNQNQYQRALNSIEDELRKKTYAVKERKRIGREQKWYVKDIEGYKKPEYDNVGITGMWAHYNHAVNLARVENSRMDADARVMPDLENANSHTPLTARNFNKQFSPDTSTSSHDSRTPGSLMANVTGAPTIAPSHKFRKFNNRDRLFIPGGSWTS